MISGSYEASLDSKNRIFIPARVREKLGSDIVLVKGIDECITVYSAAEWENFTLSVEKLPMTQARHLRRFLYSSAVECTIDGQGRIIIPSSLRDYAKLEKCVIIVGTGVRAEIWAADVWQKEQEKTDRDSMEKMIIELGF